MKLSLAFILGGSFRDDSDRRVAGSDHRSRLFKGNRFKQGLQDDFFCKKYRLAGHLVYRECATGRSHPAATANVRGFTIRKEGGITEADLTISTIYEAVP